MISTQVRMEEPYETTKSIQAINVNGNMLLVERGT